MSEIKPATALVVTILRPMSTPFVSPDDAATAFALVLDSMIKGNENAAHMIVASDGSFDCLSGHMGRCGYGSMLHVPKEVPK